MVSKKTVISTSVVFFALFMVLIGRLFYMQVAEREKYAQVKSVPNLEWKAEIRNPLNKKLNADLAKLVKDKPELSHALIVVSSPSKGAILVFATHNLKKQPLLDANPILLLLFAMAGVEQEGHDIESMTVNGFTLKALLRDSSKVSDKILAAYLNEVGIDTAKDYLAAFGIGEGAELLWKTDRILTLDLEAIAGGEGGYLSPFQILRIVGAAGNEGKIANAQLIVKGTSQIFSKLLKDNARDGSAKDFSIAGYEAGGLKFASKKFFGERIRNSCFVGFIERPKPDQRVAVLTMLNTKENIDLDGINRILFRKTVLEVLKQAETANQGE